MSMSVSAKQKRSISSAIAGFFKRHSDDEPVSNNSQEKSSRHLEDDTPIEFKSNTSIESVIKRPRMEAEDQNIGDGVPGWGAGLILYESDGNQRPPVLPILPLQRLRMLRYKQELRRRQLQMVQVGQTGANDQSRIASDSTVSTTRSLGLKGVVGSEGKWHQGSVKRGMAGKKSRLWSSNFEYDLSEYDILKKQKLNNSNTKNITSFDGPKFADHIVLKRSNSKFESGNLLPFSTNLSQAQIKLLSGMSGHPAKQRPSVGDAETWGRRPSQTQAAAPLSKASKQVPSIGFDFLLNASSETPSKSKVAIVGDSGTQVSDSTQSVHKGPLAVSTTAMHPEKIPTFASSVGFHNNDTGKMSKGITSFPQENGVYSKKSEQENKVPFQASTTSSKFAATHNNNDNCDGGDREAAKKKPAFSFNHKATNAQQNKSMPFSFGLGDKSTPSESEPDGSKNKFNMNKESQPASKPAFTFSQNTAASPAFGLSNKNVGESKSNEDSENKETPSISKSTFSFGQQVDTNSQTPPKNEDHSSEKVTFSFGLSKNKASDQKPVFKFGASNGKIDVSSNSDAADVEGVNIKDGNAANANSRVIVNANDNKSSTSKQPFIFGGSTKSEGSNTDTNQTVPFTSAKTNSDKDGIPSASLSNNKPAASTKLGSSNTPMFSFGSGPTTRGNNLGTSSFNFGNGTNKNNLASSASAPVTSGSISNSGFKFDMSGFKVKQSANVHAQNFNTSGGNNVSHNNAASNSTSINAFGCNAGNNPMLNSPQPQQAPGGFGFPQQAVSNSNLGFGSSHTSANNSPAFGASTNPHPPTTGFNFNGSTAGSPSPSVFGNSVSPEIQSSQNGFHPSTSVNLNFAGSANNLNPSQVFGQTQQSLSQGSSGSFGMIPQQQQQSIPQLPPGRRIARMRARRG